MRFSEIVDFKMPSRVKATLNNIDYYPFHMHNNVLELICIIDGDIKIYDTALDYTLSSGDVYIFNVEEAHKIEPRSDNIVLTVQIDLSHYQQFFPDVDLINDSYFVCDSFHKNATFSNDTEHLRFLMIQIYKEYTSKKPLNKNIEEMTGQLIDYLMSYYKDYSYIKTNTGKYRVVRKHNDSYSNQQFYRIYKIIDFIYENFRNKITLTELAEREYLSTAHLSRYIKESSGLNFSELLSLARCEEASKLLSGTSKSLDQIASAVGFAGRSNLTKQFKKWFSKTPTTYRKSINDDLGNMNNAKNSTFDTKQADRIMETFLDA